MAVQIHSRYVTGNHPDLLPTMPYAQKFFYQTFEEFSYHCFILLKANVSYTVGPARTLALEEICDWDHRRITISQR